MQRGGAYASRGDEAKERAVDETTRLLLAFLSAEERADAWIKANPLRDGERLTVTQREEWGPLSRAAHDARARLLEYARTIRAGGKVAQPLDRLAAERGQ